jgi:hypothetical protein
MAVHLICEGGATGLDYRLLDRLVIQHHNLSVLMAPSGGSGGLGAVRVYLLNRAPNDAAAFLAGDFLLDMGVHELMAALAAYLRGRGAPPGFTHSVLEGQLLRVLTTIYQPGVIYQPDDFSDLAAILGQY